MKNNSDRDRAILEIERALSTLSKEELSKRRERILALAKETPPFLSFTVKKSAEILNSIRELADLGSQAINKNH